ncbi:hypothetical protein [Trujillonella humicola]|uniref:hypothetical protein n=1 Tax=Trujillonella humicola TaxID=3383699 RepID=UPI00390655D7
MTDPAEPATAATSPEHTRSGDDVGDAIGVAERGTSVAAVHDGGPAATSGDAPVEQVRGDPSMTGGQVGEPPADPSAG